MRQEYVLTGVPVVGGHGQVQVEREHAEREEACG